MARKPLPAEYVPSVENVLKVWEASSNADKASGAEWYNEAHDLAIELTNDANTGAGVIAALSPQVSWVRNVTMARQIANGETPTMTNGRNIAKAQRCMSGESWNDVLGGPKVRAFAATIENPETEQVCIDRHAFDIAVGFSSDDRTRGTLLGRAGIYEQFAAVYVEAAKMLNVAPSVVQATTWVAWRHAKGIGE